MATEMMTWARRQVFEEFGLSQNEAMVLLLIADNSSWNEEEGAWTAWPSQATLARDARATDRSVRRAVTRLVDLGILSTQRRRTQAGFLRGNVYVLHPEVVTRPVTLTRADRVGGDEQGDSDRPDTASGLAIPREDTLSGTPLDPHDSKTGHTVRSVDNSVPTGHSVRSDRTQSPVLRARLTRARLLTTIVNRHRRRLLLNLTRPRGRVRRRREPPRTTTKTGAEMMTGHDWLPPAMTGTGPIAATGE